MDEAKVWKCPSGRHVLGVVLRNGSGVRQLLLYRHAVRGTIDDGPSTEVDVMAVVEGYVADVRCDLCGRVRTWVPGKEALRRLIERVKEQRETIHE
jgi:hypothetical protein